MDIIIWGAVFIWIINKLFKSRNNNKRINHTSTLCKNLNDKVLRSSGKDKYKIKESIITSDEDLSTFMIETQSNTSGYLVSISEDNISTPAKNKIKSTEWG